MTPTILLTANERNPGRGGAQPVTAILYAAGFLAGTYLGLRWVLSLLRPECRG